MLRKTMLLALVVVAAFTVPSGAQEQATEPGSWLLGGSVSYSSLGGDNVDDRFNTLMIAPSGVLFVAPGFGVGLQTEVFRATQGDAVDVSHAYLGKVLFVVPTGGKLRPVVGAGGGFIRLSTNDDTEDDSVNGWAMRLAGGAFYFLNEHYALSAELNYAYSKLLISQGDSPATDQIIFAIGFAGFVF